MWKILFAILCIFFSLRAYESQNITNILIDWNKVMITSKTIPTLQIVVNPLLRRNSTIHDRVLRELKNLNADYVRYQSWYPYPKLVVAELEEPTHNQTFWNFELMDPMMIDVMDALKGKKVVFNYCTLPVWLFKTKTPVTYPEDPNQEDWRYDFRRYSVADLKDSSFKNLTDYYVRLIDWYANGGFTDELGAKHESGYNYTIDYFELFNEMEYEHGMTPEAYTQIYDAIVVAIRNVSPNTKFVGMSLKYPMRAIDTWFPYFLNHSNHKADTDMSMISYHFYAKGHDNDTVDSMQYSIFEQTDTFLNAIPSIEKYRLELSPQTRTNINELGTIYVNNTSIPPFDEYWNLSGAMFAYIVGKLSLLGIDIIAQSQLIGYPTQYPSVSMVDWETGEPNARFRALQLLIDNFSVGDRIVDTVSDSDDVFGLAFINGKNEKKLLLINKRVYDIIVSLPEKYKNFNGIDIDSGNVIKAENISGDQILLNGFAVQIINF